MYLPRQLLSHLYTHLKRTTHQLSPPVLILSALDADALCATRILTALLKGDFIPHKIQPISGYTDLSRAGTELVRPMRRQNGGEGGVVVCLGLGATMDLEEQLFGELVAGAEDDLTEMNFTGYGGVECWVIDARRPWDLSNVFAGHDALSEAETEGLNPKALATRLGHDQGKMLKTYEPGRGGIVCFDDGDIEGETTAERKAYFTRRSILESFEPGFDFEKEIQSLQRQLRRSAFESYDEDEEVPSDDEFGNHAPISAQDASRKRKASHDDEDEEDERPSALRRRSNSSSIVPSSPERMMERRARLGGSSDTSRAGSPTGSQASADSFQADRDTRQLRDNLRKLQKCRKDLRACDDTLEAYWTLGASFSEPVSSMMYSLASDLGQEDNDLLWWAIVGVQSMEILGRTNTGLGLTPVSTMGGSAGWNGARGDHIRATLREEVRRLNPPPKNDPFGDAMRADIIQTSARGATDKTIRLSPEPRFLLVRHWSLYDSMLHSPYLSSKLHVWSDVGKRRLYKLLAKMGVSIVQSKQSYTHMDVELKKTLRDKLLKYAPQYGLEGLVPPISANGTREGWGFVRSWGWKSCLSATDVGVVVGSVLDIGDAGSSKGSDLHAPPAPTYSQRIRTTLDAETTAAGLVALDRERADSANARFWTAYDALGSIDVLTSRIATAQSLARAILRTGASLIEKRQIRHLRAFRMAVVKEGPDVALFANPGALVRLALWIAEAVVEMEGGRGSSAKKGSELVVACLDERRNGYLVVGLGGGGAVALDRERQKRRAEKRKEKAERKEAKREEKRRLREERREKLELDGLGFSEDEDEEDEDELGSDADDDDDEDDSDDDDDGDDGRDGAGKKDRRRGSGRNRFGNAFREVLDETGIENRVESFDHCIAQVRREDLSGFLESLSLKVVVG